jgi:hypothetical protein
VPGPCGYLGRWHSGVENSLYLSWLAEDYVQLGEVEHAAEMATRMAILAGRTNSARADTRLHFLAGRLEPYRENGGVADFFDAYRSVTVPTRSGDSS